MIHRRAYPNLRAYLDKTGTSARVFAKRLGVDPAHVSHILAGRRVPSLPLALKIVDEANIPIESLVGERAA